MDDTIGYDTIRYGMQARLVGWLAGWLRTEMTRRGDEEMRRGKERKGKERKGKERKGKERKGKERKRNGIKRGRSHEAVLHFQPSPLLACLLTCLA